ncbi:hypothetical protein [Bacillus ndiopicus]|nr:hypothetical protein [Bacillus ndiopicus]
MMKMYEQSLIKRLKKRQEDALQYVVNFYLPLIKGVVLDEM